DLLSQQDRLACLLVDLGRDGEAHVLLDGNEGLDGPSYTLALIAFRREGDSPAARRALRNAWRNNDLIPNTLLPRSLPEPPEEKLLSLEHVVALEYAEVAVATWRGTPGALTWLAERSEEFGLTQRIGSGKPGKKAKGLKKSKTKKKKRR